MIPTLKFFFILINIKEFRGITTWFSSIHLMARCTKTCQSISSIWSFYLLIDLQNETFKIKLYVTWKIFLKTSSQCAQHHSIGIIESIFMLENVKIEMIQSRGKIRFRWALSLYQMKYCSELIFKSTCSTCTHGDWDMVLCRWSNISSFISLTAVNYVQRVRY